MGPSVPLIPESTRSSANVVTANIETKNTFNVVSSADRFAEAVVATLGGYDLDSRDDISSADKQRGENGTTDFATSSDEKASDQSRWRDLLDDVAHLSNQVERMLS